MVKQIRKEMKAACAKCAAMEVPSFAPPPTTPKPTSPPPEEQYKIEGISDPDNTIYANQQTFNPDKLHQAIIAFRPVRFLTKTAVTTLIYCF